MSVKAALADCCASKDAVFVVCFTFAFTPFAISSALLLKDKNPPADLIGSTGPILPPICPKSLPDLPVNTFPN